MKINNDNNFDSLQLIFEKTLNVSLLSEYINTCKVEEDAKKVFEEMQKKDFDVYGVEDRTGKIIGYIEKQDIMNIEKGIVKNYYKKFDSEDLLSDSTSLLTLLEVLREKNRLFVLENNSVEKIVTIADLQKQPMRMLIFSFISLLEMQLTSVIKETFPNNAWTELLPENRLEEADNLYKDRLSKNEALSLLDSTQLCDKGTIIKKSETLRKSLGFQSNKKCYRFFKKLEKLRNNTAHSQENIYDDNHELIEMILKIKNMLESIQREYSSKSITN